jgi:aspartyl-tRNA(Asn)/glutamyl-tRNA(Gln) amidotransferase subunit A
MASENQPRSITDWQSIAAQSPRDAARILSHRLNTTFSPEQHRAVFASTYTEPQLVEAFERVVNTIAPLAGVPYVLKDLFYTANDPMRAGSGFPDGVLPKKTRDSKLPHALRGFGTILAGKTQLFEFAYGLTGENAHFGDCEHPKFPGRTSGGSSSGSAAAVAAGVVPFSVGTDTGGSMRLPAAFCGLYAFRTPAGHPLIVDAFPLAPSFDTAGWFTANAKDLVTLNRYLLGKPPIAERAPRGCYLDFEMLGQTADPEIREAYQKVAEKTAFRADKTTAAQLAAAFKDAAQAYAVLQSIEAHQVHSAWLDKHRESYSKVVWERINRGRNWTAAQEQDARIKQTLIRNAWSSFFLTYDYLVMPIAPFAAMTHEQLTQENRERILNLTTPASLGGLPALTIPIPLSDGLSTGLQVIVNTPLSPVLNGLLNR